MRLKVAVVPARARACLRRGARIRLPWQHCARVGELFERAHCVSISAPDLFLYFGRYSGSSILFVNATNRR